MEELPNIFNKSFFGKEIGEKHDFYNNDDNVTTAYHRDMGEVWEATCYRVAPSLEGVLLMCNNDYTYVFQDGCWFYRQGDDEIQKLLPECCV